MQTQEYGVAGLVDGLKDKARHMGQNSDRAKQGRSRNRGTWTKGSRLYRDILAGPDRLVKTEAKTARQVKKETETDRQIKTYIKTA